MDLQAVLQEMMNTNASDLHLKVGSPPMLRVDGQLQPFGADRLLPADLEGIFAGLTNEELREMFRRKRELDFAYSVPGLSRFRVNVFRQRGTLAIVLRMIPLQVKTVEELHLPPVLNTLADEKRGLVLVTGATGSGKTSTLAALINRINLSRRCHIVTIEDPIEILHRDNLAIINQREVGHDTRSYTTALRYVVRQDPDVILIGEMRDPETALAAMTAADTGHLVFSTLHTIDAAQTVNRILDFFPMDQNSQLRYQFAHVLRGIVSQRLLPRLDGQGRVPAVEVLVNTALVRDALLDPDRSHNLRSHIENGTHYGMQSFDQSLVGLYKSNLVTYEVARAAATSPSEFDLAARGISGALGGGTWG